MEYKNVVDYRTILILTCVRYVIAKPFIHWKMWHKVNF